MAQRRPKLAALKHYEQMAAKRNIAIYNAYTGGGHTLKEISNHFNLYYSTSNGIIKGNKSKACPEGFDVVYELACIFRSVSDDGWISNFYFLPWE